MKFSQIWLKLHTVCARYHKPILNSEYDRPGILIFPDLWLQAWRRLLWRNGLLNLASGGWTRASPTPNYYSIVAIGRLCNLNFDFLFNCLQLVMHRLDIRCQSL